MEIRLGEDADEIRTLQSIAPVRRRIAVRFGTFRPCSILLMHADLTRSAESHSMSDDELKRLLEANAAEVRRHFDETAAENRRYFDVAMESNKHEIGLIAEKVTRLDEKLDQTSASLERKIEQTTAETQAMIMRTDPAQMAKYRVPEVRDHPRHPERGGRVGVSERISNYEKHGLGHGLRILRSFRTHTHPPFAQDDGGVDAWFQRAV